MLKHIAPTRYYSEMIDLTFWQALKRFLKHGKWSWQKIHFTPVYSDDPRYAAAPFEEAIIPCRADFWQLPPQDADAFDPPTELSESRSYENRN